MTVKPVVEMTLKEIKEELKAVYAELLDDAPEETDDFLELVNGCTKALVSLENGFSTIREVNREEAIAPGSPE